MDYNELRKLLSDNITNLEQYTSITQKIKEEYKDIEINFSIINSIVKLRLLEIEYFSKFNDNGVAILLFERLLIRPPSIKWKLMSQQVVTTLQYWLEEIQHKLNNSRWWKFLSLVMKLIKEICLKHPHLPDMFVWLTGSTLFELATRETISLHQRHEVLHCLNCFCSKASREIRLEERTKLIDYFKTLASYVTSCGYMPVQMDAIETLVRWLLPRTKANLCDAAAAWFPPGTCPDSVRDYFVHANWISFKQESRLFLHVLNNASQLVTSVLITKLTVGEKTIFTEADSLTWMDVNTGISSITIVLEPKMLRQEGSYKSYETLLVEPDSTRSVQLNSLSGHISVIVSMSQPPRMQPSALLMKVGHGVTIVAIINTKSNLRRLDSALRATFRDKYQLQMDLDDIPLSQGMETRRNPESSLQMHLDEESIDLPSQEETRKHLESSSEDSAFLHPTYDVQVFRRPAGNIVKKPSNFTNINESGSQSALSPATVKSMPELQGKQSRNKTSHHHHQIDEEYYNFYASQGLTVVKESNETEENVITNTNTRQKEKAGSDTELLKQKQTTARSSYKRDELSANILLSAIVGNEESIIKSISEEISNSKDFDTTNVTEMMLRKVYGAMPNKQLKDNNTVRSTDSAKQNKNNDCSEAIEDTLTETVKNVNLKRKVVKERPLIVVSKTTTDDESNTEATEAYVDTRKRKPTSSITKESAFININEKQGFGARLDENSSSPFVGKSGKCGAKGPMFANNKFIINNTNDNIDENCLFINEDINMDIEQLEIIDIEITECINDLVDRVCNMLQDQSACNAQGNDRDNSSISKQTIKTNNERNTQKKLATTVSKPKRNTRSASKASKEKKAKLAAKTKSSPKQLQNKMSTIIERNDEESPKDEDEDDIAISKIKNNKEEYRQRKCKFKSFRKSRECFIKSPSPSTLEKDSIFDHLKSTVENNEKIKLVKPKSVDDIYNCSSDSEDSDFIIKKTGYKKRINTKKTNCSESCKTNQRMRRNTSKKSSKDDAKNISQASKKPPSRKKYTENKINIETALNDERMRDKVDEVLNTSIIAAELSAKEPVVICKKLEDPPNVEQMDVITVESKPDPTVKESKGNILMKKNRRAFTLNNKCSKTTSPNDGSGTTSPMSELIVELAPTRKDNTHDLSIDVIDQKIKLLCKEGQDPLNEEFNTQHMLLSDIEICNSPQNAPVNAIDNIDDNEKENLVPNTGKILRKPELNKVTKNLVKEKKCESKKNKNQRIVTDVILIDEVVEINDDEQEYDKSMSTDGIHAHVDSDECPPSPGLLDKTIPPREVDDTDEFENCIWASNNSASKNRQQKDTRIILEKSSNASSMPYHTISRMIPSRRSCSSSSSEHESDIRENSEQIIPQTSQDDKLRFQEKISKNNSNQHHQKQSKDDIIQHQQNTSEDGITKMSEPKNKVSLVCLAKKIPKICVAPLSLADINEWTSKSSKNSNKSSHISPRSKKANVGFRKPFRNFTKTSEDDENITDKDIDFRHKFTEKTKSRLKLTTSKRSRNSNEASCSLRRQSKKEQFYIPGTSIEDDDYEEDGNEKDFDIANELSENSKNLTRKTTRDEVSNSDTAHKQIRSLHISPIDMSIFEIQNKTNEYTLRSTKRKSLSPILHGGKRNRQINTRNEPKNAIVEEKGTNESIITKTRKMITRNDQKKSRNEPITTKKQLKLSINEPNSTGVDRKISGNKPKITQMLKSLPVSETDGVSSIYEWLEQNDCSKRDNNYTRAQVIDIVNGVMEKVDTIYAQSNEKTTKKCRDFFRDLKKKEALIQQEVEAAMKVHFQQALETCVKSNKEIYGNFLQHAKEEISKMISEDCAKKELAVTILKEDIQAVLDHIQS